MKRSVLVLFTMFLVVVLILPASIAFASDRNPPPVKADPSIEMVRQKIFTNHSTVSVKAHQEGGVNPDASTTRTVGAFTIKYSNAAAQGWDNQGRTYVQHYYGKTEKTAGTGSYQTEIHATLLNGYTHSSPSVFDYIQYPCARKVVNNGTAQSCSSPWFSSSPGQGWYIVSGHYFDIGINGTQDSTCSGCIDWVYWTQ